MRKNIQIGLKPGERIFINGAVLRVDRKVTIELLNDVTFLLESHVMQVEAATTPLRQLYFIVQTMLMDPANAEATRALFARTLTLLRTSFTKGEIFEGLERVSALVAANKEFEALKNIRALLPLEDEIIVVRAAKNSNMQQLQTKTREVA